MLFLRYVFVLTAILCAGCQRSHESEEGRSATPKRSTSSKGTVQSLAADSEGGLVIVQMDGKVNKQQIEEADCSVLFIGNSHTFHVPQLLGEKFRLHDTDKKVLISRAPGIAFLAEHAYQPTTVQLLEKGPWDFVILQAQKYSATGRYTYPYEGALALSKRAKSMGAQIIMFPEWSRQAHPDEYLRIDTLHNEIASQTGARVAPIGEAWARTLHDMPALVLHAPDGNHATQIGHYLNACVFYTMLTGASPVLGEGKSGVATVDAQLARELEEIANLTLKAPCAE